MKSWHIRTNTKLITELIVDGSKMATHKIFIVVAIPCVIIKNWSIWARSLLKKKLLHIVGEVEIIGHKK